jgi:pimeloyl-ACP methyl ester carboxylesterase
MMGLVACTQYEEVAMPRIQSNGLNLYYEANGEGQPLVFIHGLGSSTRDWEFQVSEFSNLYEVITFDLRGHGRSDKPEGPYRVPMFAADLAALLQALGHDSAHIVGLSLGGGVAFQFAIDHPSMVKTLTIVNSIPASGDDLKKEIERRVGIAQQLGMRGYARALAEVHFPKPEHATLRETFIDRWAENDLRTYIEAARSGLGWNVTDKLGSIHCPTLVISAEQDMWPLSVKEAYVKLMPNAQHVMITDSHHFATVERPEAFNAVLADFLAKSS